MAFAALAAWIMSAVVGAYLLMIWLANGGLRRQHTKVTRFPAAVVLAHPLIGVAGLAVWIMYLGTSRAIYAWSGFGLLALVVMLGFVMLTRWLVGRGGRHARGAEQHFPAVAVAIHGLVALATFALAFATAITAAGGGGR